MIDDIFRGVGIKVRLKNTEDFLKIKETLTRIGIASKKDNTLYQSCHILHKQGQYAIVHFKNLFFLDGKENTFNDEDQKRLNTIANLLEEWELLDILEGQDTEEEIPLHQIKIIPFKDKRNWNLVAKYAIGKK